MTIKSGVSGNQYTPFFISYLTSSSSLGMNTSNLFCENSIWSDKKGSEYITFNKWVLVDMLQKKWLRGDFL